MSSHLNPIDPLDRWAIATRGFGGPLRLVDSANKTVAREVRSMRDARLLAAAPAMLSAIKAYLAETVPGDAREAELRMTLAYVVDRAEGKV